MKKGRVKTMVCHSSLVSLHDIALLSIISDRIELNFSSYFLLFRVCNGRAGDGR